VVDITKQTENGGQSIKSQFVELLLESGVLTFGDFTTKSGRQSPYFFNTGRLDSGIRLGRAADLYADGIKTVFGSEIQNLYGPAYKGIPLCVAVSDRLTKLYDRDVSFTFNRKEAKAHGEGGVFVGREYSGEEKIVVVEDVLTGGTSLRETMELLKDSSVKIVGAFVGIDRQEKGTGALSARQEIEDVYGVPVKSLVNLSEIVDSLFNKKVLGKVWIDDQMKNKIDGYLSKYGVV